MMVDLRKKLVIVILVFCLPSVNAQDACSTGLCRCSQRTATCKNANLTYIPKFPLRITAIHFNNNYLPHIDSTTFLNISNRIRIITLHNNGIQSIDENVFQNLSNFNVHLLDLSNNRIKLFNISTFLPIKYLSVLRLGNNKISTIVAGVIKSLTSISINNNNLDNLPNFCDHQSSFPILRKITLQGNHIENFFPENLNCMDKLEHLNLNENAIVSLKTDYFHSFRSLTWLSIQNQGSPDPLIIQERAFNNSKILTLMLSINKLSTDHLNEHAFDGCDNLRKLDLSKNDFVQNEEKLNVALAPLKSLKKLYLNRCRLQSIPIVVAKFLQRLNYLYIGLNRIKSWPDNFFENNTDLQDLNVADNSIQTITNKMLPKMLRERLKIIALGNNPFVCNCELVWLIQWIHREPDKFFEYPKGYSCLKITEKICLNNTGLFISVTTVTCFFIFVIFTMSVIYKYIWHIKYHIYMLRYRPGQLLDIAEKHYVYDVFVAYCVEDSDWVRDNLVPIMEEGENIKLCIHERDFQGGRLIMDNIVQHMESSRKVLVVLSNDFARSKWCQFEMSLAERLVIDMSIESIVVVLLENIATVNMSKSLNALLKTTTYISWDDEGEEDVFWHKIKTSLKRPYEL
ncbi:toll-like receptor 13 [Patella vulgata]|uniref:toll-like receptor 13 n=1 Tax=Patella vulgata TaxID=6465 RepID=UPI00217F7223|nr:toll-like receptor 13 [Patella vulgata]